VNGRISDRWFFIISCVLLGLLVTLITGLAGVFSIRVWEVGDTRCFYNMAEVILSGGVPYVDYMDPKPPLIFFLLTLPLAAGEKLAGGLVLVGLANMASAIFLLRLGWKLYGRNAGLLAAVLFTINFSLAEGYFIITEPFTVTFLLLSAYFLVCGPENSLKKYLFAGLAAGIAIGFKQYALLMLPVSIFFMWRKKEYPGFLPYLAGIAIPLVIMFGLVFALYGLQAGEAAIHWSFGVAGSYVTEGDVEGVPAYKIDDPIIALSWLVLGLSLFSALILLAGASLLDKKLTFTEEFFLLAGIAFAATLLIRPFLHYWALALPFIILLAVSALSHGRPVRTFKAFHTMGDRAFILVSAVLYGFLLSVSVVVSAILVDGLWRPFEILRFYGLADILLKATNPYMGNVPEPSLLWLDLVSPGQSALVGLVVTASLLLCTALVLTGMGMTLYGRRAGLLSGTLFITCMVWVLGFISVSDALALLFLVVSLYLVATSRSRRYLLCGLCLGAAIVLKPLTVLILPALAYLLFREAGLRTIPWLVAGILVVPLVVFGIVALTSGAYVQSASGFGGISVAMLPLTTHGGVYTVTDPLIAMLNIVMAATLLTILVPVAAVALAGRPSGCFEWCLLFAGLFMLLTLPAGQYIHYWFLALPFFSLLCARIQNPVAPDQKA